MEVLGGEFSGDMRPPSPPASLPDNEGGVKDQLTPSLVFVGMVTQDGAGISGKSPPERVFEREALLESVFARIPTQHWSTIDQDPQETLRGQHLEECNIRPILAIEGSAMDVGEGSLVPMAPPHEMRIGTGGIFSAEGMRRPNIPVAPQMNVNFELQLPQHVLGWLSQLAESEGPTKKCISELAEAMQTHQAAILGLKGWLDQLNVVVKYHAEWEPKLVEISKELVNAHGRFEECKVLLEQLRKEVSEKKCGPECPGFKVRDEMAKWALVQAENNRNFEAYKAEVGARICNDEKRWDDTEKGLIKALQGVRDDMANMAKGHTADIASMENVHAAEMTNAARAHAAEIANVRGEVQRMSGAVGQMGPPVVSQGDWEAIQAMCEGEVQSQMGPYHAKHITWDQMAEFKKIWEEEVLAKVARVPPAAPTAPYQPHFGESPKESAFSQGSGQTFPAGGQGESRPFQPARSSPPVREEVVGAYGRGQPRQSSGKGSGYSQAGTGGGSTQELGGIDPELAREMKADLDGRIFLTFWKVGAKGELPQPMKARLQKKFGLYPGGGSQAFGLQHYTGFRQDVHEVNMLGGSEWEGAANRGLAPFVVRILAKGDPPKFSGNSNEWREFSREWEQFRRMVNQMSRDPLSDEVLLEILKGSLDKASKSKLEARREKSPNVTYAEFWKDLSDEFGQDLSAQCREEWKRVSLKGATRLTAGIWREFRAEFEKTLGRVEDIGEWEAADQILRELPAKLRMDLKTEELRRQEGQYWVKVTDPLPASFPEVKAVLETATGLEEMQCERVRGGYLCDCGSKRGRDAAMTMEGWSSDDGALKMVVHARKMTLDEIFRWVASQIRIWEGEDQYTGSVHKVGEDTHGEWEVQAVTPTPPRPQSPRPQGKGGVTSPSAGKGESKGKGQTKGAGGSQAAAYAPPQKQWSGAPAQWKSPQQQWVAPQQQWVAPQQRWTPPRQRWVAPQQAWAGPPQQGQGSPQPWSNVPRPWNTSPRRWSGPPAESAPPSQAKGGQGWGRPQGGGPPPKGDWWRVGNDWNHRCLVCRDKGAACMHEYTSCPAYKAAFEAWGKKNEASSSNSGGRGKGTDPGKGSH